MQIGASLLGGQDGGSGQLRKWVQRLGGQNGGSGQLCKWVQRLAGKMGEAASCANWAKGGLAGQKIKWARLQQS